MTEGNAPKKRCKGSMFTVVHCKGALDSFHEALNSVSKNKCQSFTNGMILQIKRLSNGQPMSKANFPREGDLPRKVGQHKVKKFSALKRIPIRGYCWKSEKYENTYFISHYVYKNYDELKERDTNRVGANWRRIEENGDEC